MREYKRIKIGISACLLGHEVRYDGGHKRDIYITNTLDQYFEFVPLCPEVAVGMGIPRPPIHLVRQADGIRALEVKNASIDHTDKLEHYLDSVMPQVEQVCGYILKKNSPSCGMERVKVYNPERPHSPPDRDGVGIFARTLQACFPLLPLEEEGRLCDPVLRENFIGRVFVYQRWKELEASGLTPASLVNFHSSHKYLLMAHDQTNARELGQMVAQAGNADNLRQLAEAYIRLLMESLSKRVSRGQHANVLQHLMGYLKTHLDVGDREELLDTILQYQQGYVPLIVPITLLKHHFRRHPQPYIERQYYLTPHPGELMLRNQL